MQKKYMWNIIFHYILNYYIINWKCILNIYKYWFSYLRGISINPLRQLIYLCLLKYGLIYKFSFMLIFQSHFFSFKLRNIHSNILVMWNISSHQIFFLFTPRETWSRTKVVKSRSLKRDLLNWRNILMFVCCTMQNLVCFCAMLVQKIIKLCGNLMSSWCSFISISILKVISYADIKIWKKCFQDMNHRQVRNKSVQNNLSEIFLSIILICTTINTIYVSKKLIF